MKVNINIPSVSLTITDNQGNLVLNYEISNYKLVADGKGLIQAATELKQEFEAKAAGIDFGQLLADLAPDTSTAQ